MIRPIQIKAARAMTGLTQAEFASAAGLSTNALNNIERGVTDPKASTLNLIEALCSLEFVEFFEDEKYFGVRMSKGGSQ